MALRDHLQRYREKRDFTKTAEPSGAHIARKRGNKLGYLIQKHAARREHYDFRLEHDGVLLSWACPKGPSYDPHDKRLAVHVEDHPLDYGTFEGTIPKGQYGGGTVMLWDRGSWEPHGDVDEGLEKGKLAFDLHGERLTGKWALVRMHSRGRQDRGKENWLLIKERDDEVVEGGKPITETATTSVKTGRTMDEIARGSDVWRSNRSDKKKSASASGAAKKKSEDETTFTPTLPRKRGREPRERDRATRGPRAGSAQREGAKTKSGPAKVPAFVSPQLATLVDAAPDGNGWLHEIKYDGYRALASIGGGNVLIRTRKGLDWTDRFHQLVEPLAALPCDSALLDGEIAVADGDGHTNFGKLQDALSSGRGGFGYYLFDLLSLDGEDLRKRPLIERKEKLRGLLERQPENSPLIYSDHVMGEGDKVFYHACDLKLEGIISKRAGDPYVSGRTTSWLKVKCGMEQEFVVIGWRGSDKKSRPFSSILLGVREDGDLRYCGRVGSGYSGERLDDLAARFKAHARKTPPVPNVPRAIARDAHFLEPVLVAEIAFRGWTRDGMVRQGSFKGLRVDKPASEITRERPMKTAEVKQSAKKSSGRPAGAARPRAPKAAEHEEDEIEGVHITHPDRVLFADHDVTKRELIDYYISVADRMLPHIVGRPLALVRCPQGSEKQCFYQKHANPGWPDQLHKIRIQEKSGADDYLYVEDIAGVIAAVQMGVLELHLWGSRADAVEQPDRMVFDFDPDEGLDFALVKQSAKDMRARLKDLGLESFPMVTGGKGIHVVVPLRRGHSWDEHRDFAEALARVMAEEEPERFVANMSKAKRKGKIFVDYLRNTRGATAIAPFSTRARKGAHVAWPVSWEGLGRLKDAHPASVWDAVKKLPKADPWKDYFKVKQALPVKKLLG